MCENKLITYLGWFIEVGLQLIFVGLLFWAVWLDYTKTLNVLALTACILLLFVKMSTPLPR